MQINPSKLFYFDRHFAPVLDVALYDTPEKRFGYVLSLMRQAKGLSQKHLEEKLKSRRGGSRISNWENGKNAPNFEELRSLFQALELNLEDKAYLLQLLLGDMSNSELSKQQLEAAYRDFEIYKQTFFPAYLLDHYWTILDYNDATRTFLSLPNSSAKKAYHLLQVIYNPLFSVQSLLGEEVWEKIAYETLLKFRSSCFPFRHQEKYISLVNELAVKGYRFLEFWYREPPEVIDATSDMHFQAETEGESGPVFHLKANEHLFSGLQSRNIVVWELIGQ